MRPRVPGSTLATDVPRERRGADERRAGRGPGNVEVRGGGIHAADTAVFVEDSRIYGNGAKVRQALARGAGIDQVGGTLVMTTADVSQNEAWVTDADDPAAGFVAGCRLHAHLQGAFAQRQDG
jgi:hypothetical protein